MTPPETYAIANGSPCTHEAAFPETMACPLCGEAAQNRYRSHPGYSATANFDIYHCPACETAFADPMQGEEGLYDLIYSNYRQIPGYLRYERYARGVLAALDPLDYLARMEGAYWAVAHYLERYGDDRSIRILEIGSGSGYLTYSIAQRGFTITGLDVSAQAIENATRLYGNHYLCADLFAYSRAHAEQFDLVIMTEVIEHVTAPRDFLAAAQRLLKPGGRLLVTTPDRAAFPAGAVWQTEYPPVHYWWFTSRAFEVLAAQLGMSLSFIDMTRADNPMLVDRDRVGPGLEPDRAVVFLEQGRLNPVLRKQVLQQRLYGFAQESGLLTLARRIKNRGQAAPSAAAKLRPYCLCAVLTRKPKTGRA
jgi:SAM-dependent methyltransferase